MKAPPRALARSQASRAVRALPRCSQPDGEGAKRPLYGRSPLPLDSLPALAWAPSTFYYALPARFMASIMALPMSEGVMATTTPADSSAAIFSAAVP